VKSKLFAVIGVALLSVLVLSACGGGNQPAAEPTSAPVMEQPVEATDVPTEAPAAEGEGAAVVESTAVEEAAPTAEMDMEAFIAGKVDGHHDLGRIFNATKTREEWEVTLDRMIGYGAKINDQEKEMIIDYLLSR
jgi:hypothetical protein